MQDTQGLQELAPAIETSILNYLAEHYGQKDASRRAPLAQIFMPSNPYETND
ncbi:MAG: hypothetical protein GKR91_07480 [Pseudomonadales bacterium]|nr:hypothetical protein [Pseudomonadales bacterium]